MYFSTTTYLCTHSFVSISRGNDFHSLRWYSPYSPMSGVSSRYRFLNVLITTQKVDYLTMSCSPLVYMGRIPHFTICVCPITRALPDIVLAFDSPSVPLSTPYHARGVVCLLRWLYLLQCGVSVPTMVDVYMCGFDSISRTTWATIDLTSDSDSPCWTTLRTYPVGMCPSLPGLWPYLSMVTYHSIGNLPSHWQLTIPMVIDPFNGTCHVVGYLPMVFVIPISIGNCSLRLSRSQNLDILFFPVGFHTLITFIPQLLKFLQYTSLS